MSTYSWSYKTASHRQPPVKKIVDEVDDNDTAAVSPLKTKQSVNIPNLKDSQTEKPKRLHWKAKIYVGNLNKKTNEASLAYYFSVFGDIGDVKLIRDHNTNESRGFAFITFEKIESAEKAKKWCSYNYPTLDDNSVTVASAERKVPKIKPAKECGPPRDPSQTLFWEYKWNNEPGAEVYGPYETSLMLAWKNQGYFDGGCWVRQVLLHTAVHDVVEKDCEEICEPSPSKRLKLVIDYSDSDEEETSEINKEKREKEGEKERRVKKKEETVEKTVTEIEERGILEEHITDEEKHKEHEKELLINERREKSEGIDRTEEECEQEIGEDRTENEKETTSSDDEDLEDSTEDLSTEFVAIDEIDFNFFP